MKIVKVEFLTGKVETNQKRNLKKLKVEKLIY